MLKSKQRKVELVMSRPEEKGSSKRESDKVLKDLRIITAISMGKDRNKELARVLDTDKSFASKSVKKLEERGLVSREGEGKETRYKVNPFSVLKFLQSTVVITKEREEVEKMREEVEKGVNGKKNREEVEE